MTQENTTGAADREAMEAGFNAETSGTAPVETPAPAPQAEAKPETQEEKAIEEAVIAGFKESELKSMLGRLSELDELKSENRKNFGQIGFLKKQLEERLANLPSSSPGGLKINQEALKKLTDDYPDLGFDKLFEKVEQQAQPVQQQQAMPQQQPQIDPASIKYQSAVEELDSAHPDRLQIIQTAEYANWLKTMRDEERNKFLASQSPVYVSKKLDEFKDWNAKRQAKSQANEKRLAGAVTPRGTPRAAPAVVPEDVAMRDAFNAVFT